MTKNRNTRNLDTSAWHYADRDYEIAQSWSQNPYGAIQAMRRTVGRSALAQAYLRQLSINVVGAAGPTPNFNNVKNVRDKNTLMNFWKEWAEDPTVNGKQAWPQFLRGIVTNRAIDGRIFVIIRRHPDYPKGIAAMPITRDWVVDSISGNHERQYTTEDGRELNVINGIARTKSGRIAGYLFYDATDPTKLLKYQYYSGGTFNASVISIPTREAVFVMADDCADYMTPWVTDDYDGSPSYMLPMMAILRQIAELDDSVSTAMYAASCKMGFITKTVDAPQIDPDSPAYTPPPVELERNVIEELPSGHDFTSFDPSVPNNDLWRYRQELLKNMAAGLGMDYASLAGDLREVNFSSMRQGIIATRMNYRLWQKDLERLVCRPLLKRILEWSVLMGTIRMQSSRSLEQAMETDWTHVSWAWVDPMKDAQASQALVKLGATSPQRIATGLGVDYKDVLQDIAAAKAEMAALGVTPEDLGAMSGLDQTHSETEPEDKEDEDEDDEDDEKEGKPS